MISDIVIKGARVNNLKNISLTMPRDKFIVITGLSGSGKSSLIQTALPEAYPDTVIIDQTLARGEG